MRKLSIAIATSLVAAAALVAAAPVSAQRMSLAERVGVLEQQAGNNDATVDLLRQVNMLKEEVTSLRSQVEELNHSLGELKDTSRAQFLDIDQRLEDLEGGAAPGTSAAIGSADAPAAKPVVERAPSVHGDAGTVAMGAGEREAYDAAFNALKNGEYAESARLFHSFLGHYPEGVYAPNALYWLGESYYVTQNYKLAVTQFKALLDRYPTHDKAPGALLKVGLAQQGQGDEEAAERTLTEVTTRFAGSDAARIATDRLGAIQLSRLR
ncbi:tol-pal system protein YbgF [Novilysobacter antarcticus]|uniref:tol-pal system protein YbgF n=1 Tax=Novilysobacter antarcticus TaxID=2862543 RepID=UPI003CCCB622